MKIGFVGLGLLGSAMVRRLSSQGVPLTLWNRTLDKAKNFGLPYTNTLAQLFKEIEVVFLCLRDSLAVEEVLKEVGQIFQVRSSLILLLILTLTF
jgi:3-hydroxyisobutyrate dehydrogenase-like beta-hydroxyacid dehydrogenase